MPHPSAAKDVFLPRMVCLLAIAPALGITLLVLTSSSISAVYLGLVALDVAAIARAIVIMPRGDEAVFSSLWLALGVTLGIVVVGVFSVGLVFVMTLLMLIVAIASAPNRTERSRAWWPYVAIHATALAATAALPFVFR